MKAEKLNLYWGELHTHTFCYGDPYGTIEDAAEIARSHLDFWAAGEHYNYVKGARHHPLFDWTRISRAIEKANCPGRFVTFPGFEFVGDKGDYNIYFRRDLRQIPEIKDYPALFAFARKERAMVIPHHIGYKVGCRGMQWDWLDPRIMPLIEVFSMHGSSVDDSGPFPLDIPWMGPRETGGTALTGLRRGHVFGFIGSSDGHNAYPGSYRMGLLGAYAGELTRESLWDAFWARRTYAVTGDRIVLKFALNDRPMGSVLGFERRRDLVVEAEGLDALDKIEIVKNGRVVKRENAPLNRDYESGRPGEYKIRVEWGWGPAFPSQGSPDPWEVKAELAVNGGRIVALVPCFGPPGPNRVGAQSADRVSWVSRTLGRTIFDWKLGRYGREATNSIVLTVEGDGRTVFEGKFNDRVFRHSLSELMDGSRVELMGGEFDQKIKFHEPVPALQYRKTVKMSDRTEKNTGRDFYYARVTQANGQMAWSSPIWIGGGKDRGRQKEKGKRQK